MVNLQSLVAAFYYHNTTFRKDVWNKRGSIGINLANPLMSGTRVRNNTIGLGFEQVEGNINFTRGVRLTLNYRFGTLQQPKAPLRAAVILGPSYGVEVCVGFLFILSENALVQNQEGYKLENFHTNRTCIGHCCYL